MSQRQILPNNVKPVHYDILIEPNLNDFTFSGSETITFTTLELSLFLELNVLDIDITKAAIDGRVPSIKYNPKDEVVRFEGFELKKGSDVTVKLDFKGTINDQLVGFYRLSYQIGGETKYMATTQMGPTHCRRAFPCYDQPTAKARFSFSLLIDQKYQSLANMPVKTESTEGNKRLIKYETTPLMSTYLIGYVVSDDLVCATSDDFRVPISVYTHKGGEHLALFSANYAAKALTFYEEKFGIPYPLPKVDMIAVPDFMFGAMENYGLITFRTVALLVDPEKASATQLERVVSIVLHELVHQWFGNLVTPEWWQGLYLKEAFAVWMGWYATDHFYPQWLVWDRFVSGDLQRALLLDSLRLSHPVEVPVNRVNEINQIFDAISYQKGSLVVRMIVHWLGEDIFFKGVRQYLKQHAWGNTVTTDLWKALSEASNQDIVGIMDVWTKNVGYPVVKVLESKGSITVTQLRFLITGDPSKHEDQVVFPLILTQGQILNKKSMKIPIPEGAEFKFNPGHFGFYRVAYETERLRRIVSKCHLSVADRIGLISDYAAMAAARIVPHGDFVELVTGFAKRHDRSPLVWHKIVELVQNWRLVYKFESACKADAVLSEISSHLRDQIGTSECNETDSEDIASLKRLHFQVLVSLNDKDAIATGVKSFRSGSYKANMMSAVFSAVARHGEHYDEMLAIFRLNDAPLSTRLTALTALAEFTDHLDSTLAILKTEVKSQDLLTAIAAICQLAEGTTKVWAWFQSNYEYVTKMLPPMLATFGNLVKTIVAAMYGPGQQGLVEEFFKSRSTAGFQMGLAQGQELARVAINWQ